MRHSLFLRRGSFRLVVHWEESHPLCRLILTMLSYSATVSVSLSLSVCLPACLSLSLSLCLPLSVSVCLSICLSSVCLSPVLCRNTCLTETTSTIISLSLSREFVLNLPYFALLLLLCSYALKFQTEISFRFVFKSFFPRIINCILV